MVIYLFHVFDYFEIAIKVFLIGADMISDEVDRSDREGSWDSEMNTARYEGGATMESVVEISKSITMANRKPVDVNEVTTATTWSMCVFNWNWRCKRLDEDVPAI